jgi:hypothetical protein
LIKKKTLVKLRFRFQPLLIVAFCFLSISSLAQLNDKQKLYDSLIVNTWKTESVKVGSGNIILTEEQKLSLLKFHKNHKSENLFNDLNEKGTWQINALKN